MSIGYSDGKTPPAQQIVQDNERLVAAIARGDRDAEQELALRYLKPVRVLLLARSRDPDLTADLQQDVVIEAICALRRGQLNDPAKLSQFVIAIARNLLNNHFRSSRRTEAVDLPEDLPDLRVATDPLEEQEWRARAMHAIAGLDSLDRSILQMTLVDGLKPGIIAERLRLKPDMVRQRKLRATRRVVEMVRRQSQSEFSDHILAGRAE
jgi:RNA polymerase sigma-70 factor (ECF subfamily)